MTPILFVWLLLLSLSSSLSSSSTIPAHKAKDSDISTVVDRHLRGLTTTTDHISHNLPLLLLNEPSHIKEQSSSSQQQPHDDNDDNHHNNNNNNIDENIPLIQPIIGYKYYTNSSYYYDIIPEGTKLLSPSDIVELNRQYPDMTAVIHIGPMKTGSSAIQASVGSIVGVMDSQADGYKSLKAHLNYNHTYDIGAVADHHVLSCFRNPRASTNGFLICHPELLPMVHQLAYHHHGHVVMSAESLSSDVYHIAAIRQFFSPWKHHRVVATYRRCYDWIYSLHNQGNKDLPTSLRVPVLRYWKAEYATQKYTKGRYIVAAIERWKRYYEPNELDVHMINMYDAPNHDVKESFYCQAIANAPHICQKYHDMKQSLEERELGKNPSIPLIYDDLLYHAKEMNLWNGTITKNMSHHVQYYQEQILQFTSYEFGIAKECMSNDIRQFILQQTLDYERQLFPDYYYRIGEQQIRNEFDKDVTTKLCHIHAEIVLTQDNSNGTLWRNFFTTILPTMI